MKIRIVDIAQKAGVSAGTVDRIIHQRGRYSKVTKEKVDKAIKELGYSPDFMARNLALKKELKIVCLLPDYSDIKYWERPYFGVENAINELTSFKVNIEKILFKPQVEDFKVSYKKVLELTPDGVIYVPMFFNESACFTEQLNILNIPFVHLNIHQPDLKPLSFVGQDPIAAGKAAASLCNLKLKNNSEVLITYVSKGKQEYSHLQERINGFTKYFEERTPQTIIHHLQIQTEDELKYGNKLFEFLCDHNNISIIYVPNSRAFKIAEILKKFELKNIMLIGFDTLIENILFLKEGYIDFLIGQQSKSQGYNAVVFLFNALFLQQEIKPQHLLPIDILNAENIDYYEGIIHKKQD